MNPLSACRFVLGLGAIALLALPINGAAKATPSQPSPLHIHLAGGEEGVPLCHSSERESFFGKIISILAPPLIETGVSTLGNAMIKASGELDKTHVSKANVRDYAYSISPLKKMRISNPDLNCIFVYRAPAKLSLDQLRLSTESPEKIDGLDFLARFSTTFSRDSSSFAITLEHLHYPKRFSEGKDVVGATLALSFIKPGGAVYATAAFPGSKWKLGDSRKYLIGDAPTTEWLVPRPLSDSENAAYLSYSSQCATRRAAASALRASLRAQIAGGKSKFGDKPSDELLRSVAGLEKALQEAKELPQPEESVANTLLCGYSIPSIVLNGEEFGSTWSQSHEDHLQKLEEDLKKHGAITIRFEWTETKDVNRFWLAVGNALVAKKAEIAAAVTTQVVPDLREAAGQTADVASLQAQGAYETAVLAFQARKQAYLALAAVDANSVAAITALNEAVAKKYEVLVAARKLGVDPPSWIVDFPQ